MNKCTVVMYHYVRDLSRTRYPRIKGLQLNEFRGQLSYLADHFKFVTVTECLQAMYGGGPFPKSAALLTFDDGYLDHYTNVFPLLDEMKIQGCFFVPATAVLEQKVLPVNKIHFILAAADDQKNLIDDIFALLEELRETYHLNSNDWYFNKLAREDRFDTKEIIFIKRLLQVELEEEPRKIIVDELFEKYVSQDEKAFASELYMTMDQLRLMTRHGMYIGGHGYTHSWLNSLPPLVQEEEIGATAAFLEEVGTSLDSWVFSYPYGAYDQSLLDILRRRGCRMALGTKPSIARLSPKNAFAIERLDTNDLPKSRNGFPR